MAKKSISPEMKLEIVLETIKEERHIGDIAAEYKIHTSTIHRWTQELLESAEKVYATTKAEKQAAKEKEQREREMDNLYAQIGRPTTQLDWLKKNLEKSNSVKERESMVEWDLTNDPDLNITVQADLLSLNRSSLYRPKPVPSPLEVWIKHLIDRIHTKDPARGSRSIRDQINNTNLGFRVNRKRIQRYMREMGIQVIYPGPNLSKRNKAEYVYPYLLRNEKPAYPNHIWGIDITYLPMQGRWMYLVAIVDWFSRMVVGYEIASTLGKAFVIKAAKEAIAKHGKPTILNSDQGSQFTCPDYVNLLKENSILISMDGKGRATDNAITERFWRTLKYEDVYLKQYNTAKALRAEVDEYIRYYNEERTHSSLKEAVPSSVYYSSNSVSKKTA